MRIAIVALVCAVGLPSAAADPLPETQFSLLSLKDEERGRLKAAVGSPDTMPLVRAELVVSPEKGAVTGQVAYAFTATAETSEVYLRVVPNANHDGAVVVTGVMANGQRAATAWPDPSLLRVRVAPPVLAGERVELALKVTATVPALPEGEKLATDPDALAQPGGDYGAFSVSGDVMGLSGILPMVAPLRPDGTPMETSSGVGDLGTFEPTNFVVSVSVPRGWQAVAAGHELGEVPEKGRTRHAFALAAAREFPVLLVKGYRTESRQVGEVEVTSYFHASDEKVGKEVLEHAAKALELLERKVGPYPYKTFKVVEARFVGGAGGMEFPGLMTVSRTLYRGAVDPLAAMSGVAGLQSPLVAQFARQLLGPMMKNTLEFTVDHEVAHQYFAMLVGSDPIAEPVVDEALTQHVALLLLEWRRGKAVADQVRDTQLKGTYQLYRFMGGPDRPANRATHEFTNNLEYAALVYGKAPLLFDAQRAVVGDRVWEQALRGYVEKYRYKWATAASFEAQVAGLDRRGATKIRALRQRYWDEAHGDEDVGELNLDAMLQGQGAGTGTIAIDPALAKQMEEMMKQLMGEE